MTWRLRTRPPASVHSATRKIRRRSTQIPMSRPAGGTTAPFVPVCVGCNGPRARGRSHGVAHRCRFFVRGGICWRGTSHLETAAQMAFLCCFGGGPFLRLAAHEKRTPVFSRTGTIWERTEKGPRVGDGRGLGSGMRWKLKLIAVHIKENNLISLHCESFLRRGDCARTKEPSRTVLLLYGALLRRSADSFCPGGQYF